ncbi:hypothetical protein BGX26_000389 [Mortierella sp. AD094]|nr:hypothetical protein BGX26_000389 [Mortierella sp. AD094]
MSQCSEVKTAGVPKQTLTNDAFTYSVAPINGLCVVHGQGASGACVATATMNCKNIVIVNATPTPITPTTSITAADPGITPPAQTGTPLPQVVMPIPVQPSAAPAPSSGDANNNNTPQPSSSSNSLPAIIGGSVAGAVLLIAIIAFILVKRRRRMKKRGRDRYMVQVKSEPDLDEKFVGSQRQFTTNSQLSTGGNANNGGFNGVAVPLYHVNPHPEQHQQQQQQQQQQHQQYRAMSPPVPSRTESRLSNNSNSVTSHTQPRPGTPSSTASHQRGSSPVVTKIDYTPRSTYIPSTPSTQKPNSKSRKGSLAPLPLHRQATLTSGNNVQESTEIYIDLIPVEDTPKIANAVLPEDPDANHAYSQMCEEQVNRSKSMGRNAGYGGGENYSKALVDEDEEVNEDDIMYL